MNDKSEGKGKYYRSDGDVYEGECVDDKSEGKGKYFRSDGSFYEGEWKGKKTAWIQQNQLEERTAL